jgi:hypothetical protein
MGEGGISLEHQLPVKKLLGRLSKWAGIDAPVDQGRRDFLKLTAFAAASFTVPTVFGISRIYAENKQQNQSDQPYSEQALKNIAVCESTGTRTQNQQLKRLLLYQLSYGPFHFVFPLVKVSKQN